MKTFSVCFAAISLQIGEFSFGKVFDCEGIFRLFCSNQSTCKSESSHLARCLTVKTFSVGLLQRTCESESLRLAKKSEV